MKITNNVDGNQRTLGRKGQAADKQELQQNEYVVSQCVASPVRIYSATESVASLHSLVCTDHASPTEQDMHVKTTQLQLNTCLSGRHVFTVCKRTLRHIAMSLVVNHAF